MTITGVEEARRDALGERLFAAMVGALDLGSIYIGHRLGLYRALAALGPASAPELADAAGINERYALEWLEQQAASSILDVVDAEDGVQLFVLPAGHAEALLDEESLAHVTPLGRILVACLRPVDALLGAYRNGGGVPYADYERGSPRGPSRIHATSVLAAPDSGVVAICAGDSRAVGGRPSRPCRRPRLRGRDLEHCDRARLSERARRRHRSRSGFDRSSPPTSRRERRRGQGELRCPGRHAAVGSRRIYPPRPHFSRRRPMQGAARRIRRACPEAVDRDFGVDDPTGPSNVLEDAVAVLAAAAVVAPATGINVCFRLRQRRL
jgi:Rv2258c-like winged HTH domain